MEILLGIPNAQRLTDTLELCRKWNEEHPEQPAELEWAEEMIAARARWSERIRQGHPQQKESYDRYDELRARLPCDLVVQMLEALQ
jgi:hypothetical protein